MTVPLLRPVQPIWLCVYLYSSIYLLSPPSIIDRKADTHWATVCKTVRPVLSDRCSVLSCLSVMLVYCCQMVGRIKMKLGVQVGLSPGHIVLDRDPAPPKRGTHTNFRPMSIVAKWLYILRCHLVLKLASAQETLC